MTKHVIVYGDCLEFLKNAKFEDGLHLAVTSPPYYNARDYSTYASYKTYLMFIKKVSQLIYGHLIEGGHYCLNLTAVTDSGVLYPTSTDALRLCQEIGFELVWDVAWLKDIKTHVAGGYNYENPHPFKMYLQSDREEIWVLRKGGPRKLSPVLLEKSRIQPRSRVKELSRREWKMDPVLPSSVGHPASYPLELPLRCIELFSVVGDTVYDPFLGSGTTSLAAMKKGRNSVGTEQNKEYLPIIYKRLGSGQQRIDDEHEVQFVNITVEEIESIGVQTSKEQERKERAKKAELARKKGAGSFSITDFAR